MKAPFPSFTTEWRNDTYAAIDPSRPELSHAGKTVVITGASAGIGRAIAKAYAAAGAAKVAILARREPLLKQVKADIEAQYPKTKVTWHIADVTDRAALDRAAKEIGTWDVLVLNAGYLSQKASLVESDATEWWKGYEVSRIVSMCCVRRAVADVFRADQHSRIGPFDSGLLPDQIRTASCRWHLQRRHHSSRRDDGPEHVISVVQDGSHQASRDLCRRESRGPRPHPSPRRHRDGDGGQGRHEGSSQRHRYVFDFPTCNCHPMKLADPTVRAEELPAHFIVWSTSPEGAFTASKFMYVNWDVTELKSKAEQIKAPLALTSNLVGFPWAAASA